MLFLAENLQHKNLLENVAGQTNGGQSEIMDPSPRPSPLPPAFIGLRRGKEGEREFCFLCAFTQGRTVVVQPWAGLRYPFGVFDGSCGAIRLRLTSARQAVVRCFDASVDRWDGFSGYIFHLSYFLMTARTGRRRSSFENFS